MPIRPDPTLDRAPPDEASAYVARGAVPWRRALGALVVLAALVAITLSDALHDALSGIIEAVEPLLSSRPIVGALVFVALGALSAVVAFASSAALVPVALDVWGPVVTGVLLWTGWTLGGAAAYGVGRILGPPAVARLRPDGAAVRWLGRLRPDTPLAIVALLQFALQSELSGVVLGTARYPFGRFLVSLVAVEAVFSALTVAAGVGLVERQTGVLVVAGSLLALGVVAGLAAVHRALPASTL